MKQLDEIRARYEAATPGPCGITHGTDMETYLGISFVHSSSGWADSGMLSQRTVATVGHWKDRPNPEKDAEFIAAAYTDIPRLEQALRVAIEGLDKISTHGLGGNLIPPYGDAVDIAGQTKEQIQKILEDKA